MFQFGINLLSGWTQRRLRQKGRDLGNQRSTWRQLVRRIVNTERGRATGIEGGMKYEEFRRRVAPRTYEDFLPYIERMKRGESDVLWPGRCDLYAVSSGTTAGRTKYLPVTREMLKHFRKAGLDSLLYFTARTGSTAIFGGKHLFLGGSTALVPITDQPSQAESGQRAAGTFNPQAGDLSGIAALNLPGWVERRLYEPGIAIAQMTDWPAKLDAIVERTWNKDIRLVAGIPSWILILAEQLRQRVDSGGAKQISNLKELWPNLECLVHGGVPISPFAEELHAALGPGVHFHEVYPASEGFIATQDAESGRGLRLMTDVGLFYEFLPLGSFNSGDGHGEWSSGDKAVPLEDAKVGVDYVLLLTTPAGLVRYVIGDIVRFVTTEPPRLIYVGRTSLQLSAFGEHVIEKELTDALTEVCQRHNWQIVNFHVAPLFANTVTGQRRGRHEWWVELKAGTAETPTGPILAMDLDVSLQRANEDYEAKRRGGGLDMPVVRLVIPGVFEHWMRTKGKWGGQHKMPRCRGDRTVADELAALTRFTEDTRSPFGGRR